MTSTSKNLASLKGIMERLSAFHNIKNIPEDTKRSLETEILSLDWAIYELTARLYKTIFIVAQSATIDGFIDSTAAISIVDPEEFPVPDHPDMKVFPFNHAVPALWKVVEYKKSSKMVLIQCNIEYQWILDLGREAAEAALKIWARGVL